MFIMLITVCRDEFRVCVTSQLPLEHIEEFLFGVDPSPLNNAHPMSGAYVGNLPRRDFFKIISILPDKSAVTEEDAEQS